MEDSRNFRQHRPLERQWREPDLNSKNFIPAFCYQRCRRHNKATQSCSGNRHDCSKPHYWDILNLQK